jgi:hypothetical protein
VGNKNKQEAISTRFNHLEAILMKTERILLGMTFGGLMLLTTSLYAQQEVNPDWYNPWPDQATAQAKPSPAPVSVTQAKPLPVLPQLHSGATLETTSLAGQLSQMLSHPVRKASAIQVGSSFTAEDPLSPSAHRRRAEPVAEPKSGS